MCVCVSGLEQVHDAVEQSLLKEVSLLRECQDKFRMMLEKVKFTIYSAASNTYACHSYGRSTHF